MAGRRGARPAGIKLSRGSTSESRSIIATKRMGWRLRSAGTAPEATSHALSFLILASAAPGLALCRRKLHVNA
jgi:hypothetical protein